MEKSDVKRFIYSFFGKNYSEEGKHLFGAWMRAEGDEEAKREALQELWEKSEGVSYTTTHADWQALRKKMIPASARKSHSISIWVKYAAVVALMIVSASVAWWVKEKVPVNGIAMQECFVPYGEGQEVSLGDGTKVWVNAGSLLVYPQHFEETSNRTVYLTGEAHFAVAKNAEKPFIVKTALLDIQALGTSFTIAAYLNEPETRATLEEGSIQVDVRDSGEQPFILVPSEQLVYNHLNSSVDVRHIDLDQFKLKRAGYLIFENVTFEHLINTLERKYGVTVQYNSEKYVNGRYNVKFAPSETLEEALEVLVELLGVDYTIKDNVVYIK